MITAYHFLHPNGLLRDGRKPPRNGVWLKHKGDVVLCESGLHASRRALHALQYAESPVVSRVWCRGDIIEELGDKLVCRERKILWRYDATDVLLAFGRRCALDVIDKWDAPEIVRRYLETGDESIRAAARDAAWDAARAAARDAAWGAARDAAWGAALDAARAAAWDAARDAAWGAAWDAARDAARAAARDAAWGKYADWLDEMIEAGRPGVKP